MGWFHSTLLLKKEQLKKVIDEYDKKFKDVKGFSHSAEYKDSKIPLEVNTLENKNNEKYQ